MVAYFNEWKIAVRALESSYFGLDLGWIAEIGFLEFGDCPLGGVDPRLPP